MLTTKLSIEGVTVPLPAVPVGQSASLTDYTTPETEIVIFQRTQDGGEVWVSKAGYSVEVGLIREIHSADLRLEKKFGNKYTRNIKTKFGEGVLLFEVQ